MAYHKILNQYELAVFRKDNGMIDRLNTLRREAVTKRDASRRAVEIHTEGHKSMAAD